MEDFYSNNTDSEKIDFGKIFRFLLMQSKLIVSIMLAAFVLSYVNYIFSTPKYKIQSLLQYESFNQSIFDPSKSLQMASGNSVPDVSNLAALYESRTNILKLIKDLRLNIKIKDLSISEHVDIAIDVGENYENNTIKNYKFTFSFYDKGYVLLDDELNEIQKSEYGKEIKFDNLKINIKSANLIDDRHIKVNFQYPESMYNSVKSRIVIDSSAANNSFFSKDALIEVSYVTEDIELGKKIINYANNIFLNQRISVETEKSRKAINFIEKNMISLNEVLEKNKIKLKEFLEKNKSINFSLEVEGILKRIQTLDQSISTLDYEIAKAQEIYTTNNPLYANLLSQKKLVERQKESVLSEIKLMPKEQQDYIDLYNDVEITRALFEELESRRLGFSILEASTIGDIRVVDYAYVNSTVSPRISSVFQITFISLIFACLFAIIRGFNFLPISNPAEIFDNSIHVPIIGVLPSMKDVNEQDDTRFNSSIESLILNISSIQKDQPNNKLIAISSPSPFNGKSTLAKKLADGYSRLGKKVLLIDADLKRGKLNKAFNVQTISQKTFKSIDETSLENYNISDNLYVIPRITGLINTFQFLYSFQFKEKVEFLKNHFDIIIFDTAPILSVSDSSILIEQSDFNILVVRHGLNKINELKQSVENYKQINKKIDGIAYNAYAKPSSYYGYYGIYGNYSYQYYADKYLSDSYDYDKKD